MTFFIVDLPLPVPPARPTTSGLLPPLRHATARSGVCVEVSPKTCPQLKAQSSQGEENGDGRECWRSFEKNVEKML